MWISVVYFHASIYYFSSNDNFRCSFTLELINNEIFNNQIVLKVHFLGCETGNYGGDCSKKCDHCKNNASCAIQNGECDDIGCASPVYQHPLCKGKFLPLDIVFPPFPRH